MTTQPPSHEPARIAVAGAGRIGREHIRALRRSRRLVLAGVADPSEPARDAYAAKGVTVAKDVEALMDTTPVDAVIVAVPSAHHLPLVSRLLERGVPVLCEKPCGLRSADLLELGARAHQLGTPLQIGYWRRFVPSLRALRARIADGSMGELSMVTAIQWDGEPPSAAFRDVASSGGILIDMGVHEFDMLRWLTGQEIVELTGFASDVNYADPVPGDPETVNLVARMSGGTTAVVSLARRCPPGDVCRVEVLGGDATEQLTFVEPGDDGDMLVDAFQAQAEHLADIARGAQPAGATLADAYAALVAAEAGAATFAVSRESSTMEVAR